MKRTDITELFPDATKEQIDKLMGINGADINEAKKNLADVQKQLDAALAAPKDDEALKAAQAQADKLQKELDGMKAAESLRLMREKIAKDTGVPAALLTGTTEEECTTQASGIKDYAKTSTGYPVLRDGGEKPVNPNPNKPTREQFAEYFQNL